MINEIAGLNKSGSKKMKGKNDSDSFSSVSEYGDE